MKKLIIVRGPQGVGKSVFFNQLGLKDHIVSSDALRLILGAPELNAHGGWEIPQDLSLQAWKLFDEIVQSRMERGETVGLDAMFRKPSEIQPFIDKGLANGYDVLLVDFSTMPIEQARIQNQMREPHRIVSEACLRSTFDAFEKTPLNQDELAKVVQIECWDPVGGTPRLIQCALDFLTVPVPDFSHYKKIVHIGDLQGCLSVLIEKNGILEQGFDKETLYIFAGDLVDRGIENGILMRWLKDNALNQENVIFVWGNHEDHLARFSEGKSAVSREFREGTLPQLLAEGITAEDVKGILDKTVEVLPYTWNGQKIVVVHAGLSALPPMSNGIPLWHLLSSKQLSKGPGSYSDPIDATWSATVEQLPAEQRWMQVHGHRNKGAVPVQAGLWSINLEDQVEFGGNLRTAILSESGWEYQSYKNNIYASWRQRFGKAKTTEKKMADGLELMEKERAFDVMAPVPNWIVDTQSAPAKLDADVLKALRDHPGVLEKAMHETPHISSMNFARDVFFDKSWDEVVVKARGLFFDTESGSVVARGYDKFFNVGERPETKMEALRTSLSFPVTGFVKENGYLGNLGYDSKNECLFCASKSTSSGPFADWFKEILDKELNVQTQERLCRYLRDAEASMVFEVIDPIRDPHMIKYEKAKLVLLDVFHRSSDGKKLPYEQLKKVGETFGLEVKKRAFEFKNFEAMEGWINRSGKDLAYQFSGAVIEGVVIEDKKGFMTKIKLPNYGFWKSMRSNKDRLAKLKLKLNSAQEALVLKEKKEHDLALKFGKPIADEKEVEDFKVWLDGAQRAGLLGEEFNLSEVKRVYGQHCSKAVPKGLFDSKEFAEVIKFRGALDKLILSDEHPLAQKFLKWCNLQSIEGLAADVITLRDRFDKDVGISPDDLAVRWARFDPSEKENRPTKAVSAAPAP